MKHDPRLTVTFLGLAALTACTQDNPAMKFAKTTDATGCTIEQVTGQAFDEYQVQGVSRDGRHLAYTENRGEDAEGRLTREVFILDLETGDKKALDPSIENAGAFSPDGRFQVVADDDEHGKTEIIEIELESGALSVIASAPEAWDWLPSYSPDGEQIVFNSNRADDHMDVYTYRRSSGDLRRLTTFDGYDAHAQYSPDGTRILFHRMQSKREDGGYNFDLYTIDLASGAETQLTDGPFEESYGAFAPDGRYIVLSSDFEEAPEKHNLYVRAPDGALTALTDGDWVDRYAYWTADGAYIYFNSDRGGVANIYRIPMQGTDCARS